MVKLWLSPPGNFWCLFVLDGGLSTNWAIPEVKFLLAFVETSNHTWKLRTLTGHGFLCSRDLTMELIKTYSVPSLWISVSELLLSLPHLASLSIFLTLNEDADKFHLFLPKSTSYFSWEWKQLFVVYVKTKLL